MDDAERDKLVLDNDGLAHAMAVHYFLKLRRHIEFEDLLQDARLGLVKAAQRWRSDRGPFKTFALCKIRGAILDSVERAVGQHPKKREAFLSGKRIPLNAIILRCVDRCLDGLILIDELERTLSARAKAAITEHFIEGRSFEEVGRLHNMAANSAGVMVWRALRRMKAAAH